MATRNFHAYSGSPPYQTGFIQGAILFGIALLTAVIGGFAMANRSPNTQTSQEQAKVNASVFLKQGGDLREGFSRYLFDQGSTDTLTFDTATGGLFESAKQYAVVQLGPGKAYDGGTPPNVVAADPRSGSYTLHKSITINNVGTGAAEWVVATVFSDATTCRRINNMLYGLSMTSTIPASGITGQNWVTGGGTDTLPSDTAGWTEGCVEASGVVSGSTNRYVYFKVVREG